MCPVWYHLQKQPFQVAVGGHKLPVYGLVSRMHPCACVRQTCCICELCWAGHSQAADNWQGSTAASSTRRDCCRQPWATPPADTPDWHPWTPYNASHIHTAVMYSAACLWWVYASWFNMFYMLKDAWLYAGTVSGPWRLVSQVKVPAFQPLPQCHD